MNINPQLLENSLTITQYYQYIEDIVAQRVQEYDAKYLPFIKNSQETIITIKNSLQLNKKFFNMIQNIEGASFCFITEPWCLDANIVLPLLESIEAITDKVDTKLYLRDSNESLMNLMLTNKKKSIPVLFILDKEDNFLMKWGARTENAHSYFNTLHEVEMKEKVEKMSAWYIADGTNSIQESWYESIRKVLK